MMCKTCRDYAGKYCHKYIHVYIFPCAISHSKQVIQSVCSKQIQGLGEITCHPLETSVNNELSQYFSLNYIQEAKSSNSISFYLCFSPPPVEAHHHFKAPRQSERLTLVTILQGCQSGKLIEKQQHQDIPGRAPLSHITVTGSSHDLQDATSVPSKET